MLLEGTWGQQMRTLKPGKSGVHLKHHLLPALLSRNYRIILTAVSPVINWGGQLTVGAKRRANWMQRTEVIS